MLIMDLDRDGYLVTPPLLAASEVAALRQALAHDLPSGQAGVRGLLDRSYAVRALADDPRIHAPVVAALGSRWRIVRAIFFNKTLEANWQVAWHQDLTIAVQDRHPVPGYGPWSVKQGVIHVQAPVALLERMLTLRLHLDDTDSDNGALLVAPGSHRLGRLEAAEAAAAARACGPVSCDVAAGAAMLFKPLLLHASLKSTGVRPRRVIHLEFAAADLPPPLAWC